MARSLEGPFTQSFHPKSEGIMVGQTKTHMESNGNQGEKKPLPFETYLNSASATGLSH